MYKITSFIILMSVLVACSSQKPEQRVNVYVSEDQVFSEPVLKTFEKESGIKVYAIYDTEESKSTGVMNRLIAEKENPQADVYWANEPIRAEILKYKGVLAPYESKNAIGISKTFKEPSHYWTGFSARVRLFITKKEMLNKPHSILDYVNPLYQSKAVIANPLFGTTTAHIAALFTIWGEKKTKTFLNRLKENKIIISSSNGESADFVASNHYLFALVDSDDAMSKLKNDNKVDIIYPDQGIGEIGAFVVPNAVMLINHAPHPNTAKKLIDFLLSEKSEKMLAFADCAQIPLHQNVYVPKGLKPLSEIKIMQVEYTKIAKTMLKIQPYLKEWLQNR